jgi:hypothetical protein
MSFGDAHLRKRMGFSPDGTIDVDPTDPIQAESFLSLIPESLLPRILNFISARVGQIASLGKGN